ncbi:hypothetical protein [Desulfuromonas thiophila]|uniref:Cyanophycin synthetase n=1 Tax=Desulfuromonas thiophila TaxID=57664 RepID=A0A1G7EXC4_9BACT|nr:hypothetical protein [Desulfuromonas thiophila]SDE68291.1 cyanophycin synthetase [Desulfuromonas thiophila]
MSTIRVEQCRFYPGSLYALEDSTLVVQLRWPALLQPALQPAVRQRLQACVAQAFAAVAGVSLENFPAALLCEAPPAAMETPAHWLAALCVAWQRQARDAVGPAQLVTQSTEAVVLALPCWRPQLLRQLLPLAVRQLLAFLAPIGQRSSAGQELNRQLATLLEAAQREGLSPNSLCFALAARRRGIPLALLPGNLLLLGQGEAQQRLNSSFTGATSVLATRLAKEKLSTNHLLAAAGLPVPRSLRVTTPQQALQAAETLGWPVVVKPARLDQGRAVVPDIRDWKPLLAAFEQAQALDPGQVLVEQHIKGEDHRLLVVQGVLLMATRRAPGGVLGDGQRSVMQLLDALNADPRRGSGKRSLLMRLELDAQAADCLQEQGLAADAVPAAGRFVVLRRTANISTGGTAEDVTCQIHPDNRLLAERAARLIGLDIAGIDFISPDIRCSWRENGAAICEVNAQPGFRPHWLGDPARDINGEIIERLFAGRSGRIPTTAIAGSRARTGVAHLLHHLWRTAGCCAGLHSAHGLWLGNQLLTRTTSTANQSCRMLLPDPGLQALVLEICHDELLEHGHPLDGYAVAALLGGQSNQPEEDDRDCLDGLREQVVARTVEAVVVNAADARSLALIGNCRARRRILVAPQGRESVWPQLQADGEAVYWREERGLKWLILAQGERETRLLPSFAIPLTGRNQPQCHQVEVLFAVALGWAHGLTPETLKLGLTGFDATVVRPLVDVVLHEPAV